ncbi:ethanolamine utilization protein EutP [Pseudodesulfovibrio cashew]|uniref:Ethanolamine utilization protein EutP n=1 Tax=Pseudodesulfovibrio cashew TaxID=2678688 RepID=A0A6I6JVY1_9BACT|nr:EutP/PduV family microcompartment system protein [Pseudodesulfovibrio cashew]QGY41884.1 ethanolamine utilization protein EutP [Pseudodesulfovibrio cashew]
MKRFMFIGETNSGKSGLIRALSGESYSPRRAMAVEFFGRYVNTPGEFLENSRYYHALITSSADCAVLVLVQDATSPTSLFPPLFAPIFNRPVVGVVTRSEEPGAAPDRAERFLRSAGVRRVVRTDFRNGTGFDLLDAMLSDQSA